MAKKKVASEVSEYLRKIGRKGGKAKVSKGVGVLPPEERKALGQKAAKARWAKKRADGKVEGG